MSAKILSGKPIAEAIKADVAAEVEKIRQAHNFRPCLVAVRVGDDPASAVYVANKVRATEEVGMISGERMLSADTSQSKLEAIVNELNQRVEVDGILVQLPLPKQIDERRILERIDPEKDVDGFHPVNAGRLMSGDAKVKPCTPAGIIELLKRSDIPIDGARAVVIGRSNIVGKPMALLLLQENATVTICHSRSRDLPAICRSADILVAAVGRPGFVTSEHIREGAAVIDVGINRITDAEVLKDHFTGAELEKRQKLISERGFTIVGDVRQKDAVERAGSYTPVPGGVGLLTVAMLMKNTLEAAKSRRHID
jgi:methylenetetrahydrofolate dehydrogenase (NADP+)/methenyltetrahydrofolate cyclohydrolase